jgi:hypothetical protein
MSVELSTLVPVLRLEVNEPGSEDISISDDEGIERLSSAFWEIRFLGMLTAFTEASGEISPNSGTTEMTRDLQQIIVLVAGIKIVEMKLLNILTTFKASAGPTEFETQRSAQVLRAVLDNLNNKLKIAINRLSDIGGATASFYIDALSAQHDSLVLGDIFWLTS